MMYRTALVFALAAISLFASEPPPASEQPSVTFRSDVSLARVDAQVVDSENRTIKGLKMEDFVLRQNGKQQEIRHFANENLPVDVILLLDVSRSMGPHVERIASSAHQALGMLQDQDRIAIMVFDRASRVRMPFSNNRKDAEREIQNVVDQESFDGGTDITQGLLDATGYMARHARRDARRAIVILTDDQTEFDRDDAGVLRALNRADSVLSALIAPDALHTGATQDNGSSWNDGLLGELKRRGLVPRDFGTFGGMPSIAGPHTQSAGTSTIARQSGGDSMAVDEPSAFADTLTRLRERYALYFYEPEDAKSGDNSTIEVELSGAARARYPGAVVRTRRSSLKPDGAHVSPDLI